MIQDDVALILQCQCLDQDALPNIDNQSLDEQNKEILTKSFYEIFNDDQKPCLPLIPIQTTLTSPLLLLNTYQPLEAQWDQSQNNELISVDDLSNNLSKQIITEVNHSLLNQGEQAVSAEKKISINFEIDLKSEEESIDQDPVDQFENPIMIPIIHPRIIQTIEPRISLSDPDLKMPPIRLVPAQSETLAPIKNGLNKGIEAKTIQCSQPLLTPLLAENLQTFFVKDYSSIFDNQTLEFNPFPGNTLQQLELVPEPKPVFQEIPLEFLKDLLNEIKGQHFFRYPIDLMFQHKDHGTMTLSLTIDSKKNISAILGTYSQEFANLLSTNKLNLNKILKESNYYINKFNVEEII